MDLLAFIVIFTFTSNSNMIISVSHGTSDVNDNCVTPNPFEQLSIKSSKLCVTNDFFL